MTAEGGSEIAVILLNEDGTIVDAHASCEPTFGWRREDLLGQDIRELLQFGRDLLMSQLHLLETDDAAGNTSFSVRVLARRKDQQQFPARATVRRFQELDCWTVAFYRTEAESAQASETQLPPSVSPEEIALAKKAMESGVKKRKSGEQKGGPMSVSRLWRNSRLLFSAREDKASEEPVPAETAVEPVTAAAVAPAKFTEPAPAAEKAQPAQPVPPAPARIEAPASSEHFASLARIKAELEKERGERARAEQRAASLNSQVKALHLQISENLNLEQENQERVASLEQELRETRQALSQAESALEHEKLERRADIEQLEALRALNGRLEENLALFESARKNIETVQKEQQARFEQSQKALKEAEAAAARERDEHHRLEQALRSAGQDLRAAEQKAAEEISRLKAALELAQLEKNRGEEASLRSRAEAVEASRESRARLNALRHRFTGVLDHINGTTSELLQSPLSEEQKCVVEALLQDVISLQETLDHDALPGGAVASVEPLPTACAA